MAKDEVILAFGSNMAGEQGGPVEVLEAAVLGLQRGGVRFLNISSLYVTPASGASYQPDFYNFVASCETSHHPEKLLRLIKQMERQAGRRGGLYWGPRPLDIDIIDYKSRISGWRVSRGRQENKIDKTKEKKVRYGQAKVSQLIYPHKEMHRRGFVLLPLSEICPFWRHPVFGSGVRALLSQNCSPLEIRSIERLEKSIKL